jgi:hypothetical protein
MLLRQRPGVDGARVQYCGDDALPALAGALENRAPVDRPATIAVQVGLANESLELDSPHLDRLVHVLAAAAQHVAAGVTCDLLVTRPGGRQSVDDGARRLEGLYGRCVAAGTAPPLAFRTRNILDEVVNDTFRFSARLLVTCSYDLALTGVLSHCPTLWLLQNERDAHAAAGLADAFRPYRFATAGWDEDASAGVRLLLGERRDRPPGNASYAMWTAQADKAVGLARVCLEMDRALARTQLELTAGAFREAAANLGELRKRRLLEERLAKELRAGRSAKYTAPSYWRARGKSLLASLRKRFRA